jgi:16S rRNA (adenine1518-N6/adenine1519-N6)-dimethyltransferase
MEDLVFKTREICKMFDIKPSRSKGQNFLINERIYNDIVKAAEINSTDEVLEVGPGLGFLTVRLAQEAKKVVAVELDDQLAAYLKIGFESRDEKKVKIVNEDVLKFNIGAEFIGKYKIVANLPYNITSIFLRTALTGKQKPELLVLMLQKEVAERIIAEPSEMSMLAVSIQYYADVSIVKKVAAGNFWPEPKVDSAIIKIQVRPGIYNLEKDKKFFRMVKSGFSAKRKMLKNNLAGGLQIDQKIVVAALQKMNLDLKIRAEDLSLDNWHKLFAELNAFMV